MSDLLPLLPSFVTAFSCVVFVLFLDCEAYGSSHGLVYDAAP